MIDRPNTCDIVRPGVSGVLSFLNRSDHTNFFYYSFSYVLFLVLFVFVSFPNETLFFFRLRKGKSSPISFLLSRSRTRPTKKRGMKGKSSSFLFLLSRSRTRPTKKRRKRESDPDFVSIIAISHPPYKKEKGRESWMLSFINRDF